MINTLRIEVDPKISILAGFEYGREIWNTQCSLNETDITQDYYLILPEQIKGVASGFVNGFFEKIVEKIGVDKAAERLHVNNERLEARIKAFILLNK